MKKVLIWSIAIVALFAFAACGGGGGSSDSDSIKLYGTIHGEVNSNNSTLVMLSPDDGSFMSTIGETGYYINGLECDSTSGKLYATTSQNDGSFTNGLIEIDMMTAAVTTIGPMGHRGNSLTSNSSGDLYAYSKNGGFLNVDPMTGTASTFGPFAGAESDRGLAFDSSDILYLVSESTGDVQTISTTDASSSFIGTVGTRAHHGDFHPETDLYWGINETWITSSYSSGPRNLVIVDVSTPAVVGSLLPTVDDLHVITFCQ